jgi:LPS-assembly protein
MASKSPTNLTPRHQTVSINQTEPNMATMVKFLFTVGLLTVSCAWGVSAQNMPFQLQADNIAYDASASQVIATGIGAKQVHVSSTQGQVKADKLSYNLTTNRVLAEGNVVFTDPDQTKLSLNRLELTGDLKSGTLAQLRLAIPALGEIASAESGSVSNSAVTLKNIAYSPCEACTSGRKAWEIFADEATYDQNEHEITYHNATMEVYGVPVAYVPWFRHPLGSKEAQSGLLTPNFGHSTTLGDQITLAGYIWNPAENADYTIRNRLMSARGAQFMVERRQQTTHTNSEIKASYLNDNGYQNSQGALRSHLEAKGEYAFTPNRRAGVNLNLASDDTYLNQYFNRNDPYLASTAYIEDGGRQHYLGADFTHFYDLNETRDPARTAQIMPHLEAERWWALDHGAQINISGDMLNLQRSLGTDTRRIVGNAGYTLPTILPDGSKVTLAATARADIYSITGRSKNGVITRALPEVTAMWEKPYLSASGYHTLAPQVMVALSSRGGNKENRVPNEDSVAYELDTSNLFEASRFAGLDRVETGPRVIFGLDNRWGTADKTDYRFFFGQSIRRFDDSSLPQSGGASTNVSDWVGNIEANPADWFSISSRFRLDNSTFVARRIDGGIRLGATDATNLSVNYSFLDNGPENASTELQIPFSEDWKFNARTRNDLANSILLQGEAGLMWTRDCYAIEFVARRKGFRNASVEPGTDYLVNLQLLTLGRE